jgi:hypothetical protein
LPTIGARRSPSCRGRRVDLEGLFLTLKQPAWRWSPRDCARDR